MLAALGGLRVAATIGSALTSESVSNAVTKGIPYVVAFVIGVFAAAKYYGMKIKKLLDECEAVYKENLSVKDDRIEALNQQITVISDSFKTISDVTENIGSDLFDINREVTDYDVGEDTNIIAELKIKIPLLTNATRLLRQYMESTGTRIMGLPTVHSLDTGKKAITKTISACKLIAVSHQFKEKHVKICDQLQKCIDTIITQFGNLNQEAKAIQNDTTAFSAEYRDTLAALNKEEAYEEVDGIILESASTEVSWEEQMEGHVNEMESCLAQLQEEMDAAKASVDI